MHKLFMEVYLENDSDLVIPTKKQARTKAYEPIDTLKLPFLCTCCFIQ